MPATSRFMLFDITEDNGVSHTSSDTADAGSSNGRGTIGYAESSATAPDVLTIQQGVNDNINVNIDSSGADQIQVTSGTNLDARMIAREMSFKLKGIGGEAQYDFCSCEYTNTSNGKWVYRFYSGSLGPSSSVATTVGSNDLSADLFLDSPNVVAGAENDNSGTYTGTMTASGVFTGQLDDIYTVIISDNVLVGESVASGSNTYDTAGGTVSTAGEWNEGTSTLYTITVNGATNPTMNGGTGNVPTMTWTASPPDNNAVPVELLYSDYWLNIGTNGLRMKFSDAPFGSADVFQIQCTAASGGVQAVGDASYVWSGRKEGKASSVTTTSGIGTRVGTLGVEVSFSSGSNLTAGDEFRILASGPQPTTYGVTTLNYGAVTVSTYSPVKAVWFELVAGATILDNVKFGLQSHGTSQHHDQGSSDTLFAFGTAGAGNSAGVNPQIQTQWRTSVTATDLSVDTPGQPDYLSAVEDNLSEVATADASEAVGVGNGHMISDFIWLAVKLGANETGANPSITYRCFYDFS